MIATSRHLLGIFIACAAVAWAGGGLCAEVPAEGAHRGWLATLAHAAEVRQQPADAAIAAALRQHLCAGDATCFSETAWRALDTRALGSKDPAVLTLAANVASYRAAAPELAPRWAHIAAIDRDNAYPLIMQASAEWNTHHHSEALEHFRAALSRPRDDDPFRAAFRLIRPSVDAAPPSLDQISPCSLLERDAGDAPAGPELRASALFEIVSDAAFPAHLGYLMQTCNEIPPEDSARREVCQAIGAHMARHATSQLSRSVGLAMQRLSSNDPERQNAVGELQRSDLDELHRKLWWVQDAPDDAQRTAAIEYWIEEIGRVGEIAAADSLVRRFGEPPTESRAERERRFDQRMEKAQACYARISHDR
jgi:hypothetical protein